jgi:hypothetical protein
MTGAFHGKQTRRDFLAPLIGRDFLPEASLEDVAVALEQALHAPRGRAAHLAVVHPEFPLGRGHQHFGVRKRRRAVGR